jgi:hypothetical protein
MSEAVLSIGTGVSVDSPHCTSKILVLIIS